MSDPSLVSRVHLAGCIWQHTSDCHDELLALQEDDLEAYAMFADQWSESMARGLMPTTNQSHPNGKDATHRCPVGDRVDGSSYGFSRKRPKPWAGELYATSYDDSIQHRLIFIEVRQTWSPPTEHALGCGMLSKASGADGGDAQTEAIGKAMDAGVTWCEEKSRLWRRWNTA